MSIGQRLDPARPTGDLAARAARAPKRTAALAGAYSKIEDLERARRRLDERSPRRLDRRLELAASAPATGAGV